MTGSHLMPAALLASAEHLAFSGDAATRCPGPLWFAAREVSGTAGMELLLEHLCAMAPGRVRSCRRLETVLPSVCLGFENKTPGRSVFGR